jgi:hypothetical protein
MKRLTLVCDCGAERTFRASDAEGLIKAIDASGWQDTPGIDLPTGQMHGDCPECRKDD